MVDWTDDEATDDPLPNERERHRMKVRRRWLARRRRAIIRGHRDYMDSAQLIMLSRLHINLMEEELARD
jgi:hypothetical protein